MDSDAQLVMPGLLSQNLMNAHSHEERYLGFLLPTYLSGFFISYNPLAHFLIGYTLMLRCT